MNIKIEKITPFKEYLGQFFEAQVCVDDKFYLYAVLCDFNSETWEEADLYVYTLPYRDSEDPSKYEADVYEENPEFEGCVKPRILEFIRKYEQEQEKA